MTLPTADEMRAVNEYTDVDSADRYRFEEFAHKHWSALIAMRKRLDELERSNDLLRAANTLFQSSNDGFINRIAALEAELAAEREKNRNLQMSLTLHRGPHVTMTVEEHESLQQELAAANETIKLYAKSCGQLADALRGE